MNNETIKLLTEFYTSKEDGETLRVGFWKDLVNAMVIEHGYENPYSESLRNRITKIHKQNRFTHVDDFVNAVFQKIEKYPSFRHVDEDIIIDNDTNEDVSGIIKQHDKKYYYNETTNTWVFWLKASPKPLVINGDDLKSLKSRYSNWDGAPNTLNQLARDFAIPRNWLIELFKVMGITHDSDPFLDNEILEKDADMLVEEVLQNKKRIIYQKLEASQWDEIKRKAKLYDEYDVQVIKPLIEKMMEVFPTFKQSTHRIVPNKVNFEESCLIFSPTDIHYGKFPFLNTEYTPKLFEEAVLSTAKQTIERIIRTNNITEIIAVSGSDFFHIDNISHSTSALTSQAGQLYGNYHDVMVRGYALAIKIWDMLVETGIKIHTVSVPGNHDKVYSLGLGLALEQRYRNVPNFTIDNTIFPRKFAYYGRNLFCFEHGENIARAGAKRTSDIMTTILLDTKQQNINAFNFDNYFYFTGHYHKKAVSHDEEKGIMDIVLPSLSVTDMWHKDNRFEGNSKSIGSYIFNEDNLQTIYYETSSKLKPF